MISECTDCLNCASFDYGYRVFCIHPNLSPEEVCKYFPVGDGDAERCHGFEEGEPEHFSMKEFLEAEEYSTKNYRDVTYLGIREWLDKQLEDDEEEW